MNISPNDLVQICKMVSAAMIPEGPFHEELTALLEAGKALDEKMALAKTMEQFEARRGEITKELEEREKKVSAGENELSLRIAQVKEAAEALASNQAKHEVIAGELASRESSITAAENRLAADQEAFSAKIVKLTAEMDERQQRLVDRENKVKADESALRDKVARAAKMVGV